MFVGRDEQLKQLGELWRKPVASLVTCRGRRRIGKSTLIEEFARRGRVRFFKLEGLQPRDGVGNAHQLEAFGRQLAEQTGGKFEAPGCWYDAFARLDGALGGRGKTVVLLDEISWMGKHDANFCGELKYAWDNRFGKRKNLIMVLCGSVSSWIDKNILKSKGFVGRTSLNLTVPELPMREAMEFWTKSGSGSAISVRDVVDVLSVTGGVPKYLESVDTSAGADENIARLCFRPGAPLLDEFDEIFDDALDANLAFKKKLMHALADGAKRHLDLAKAMGVDANGFLTENLQGLEAAGFVAQDCGDNLQTGKRSNRVRWRICDNYARFYLRYVEPHKSMIKRNAYRFANLEQLPGWSSVLGLQFEALVFNNLDSLLKEMGLDRMLVTSAAPYRQEASERREGCQIDLLVQTRHSAYVVEVKRREFIGEETANEVREKLRRLKARRGMNVIPVLVYEGRLSKRVEADGFFARCISAGRLLGAAEGGEG